MRGNAAAWWLGRGFIHSGQAVHPLPQLNIFQSNKEKEVSNWTACVMMMTVGSLEFGVRGSGLLDLESFDILYPVASLCP